VIKSIKKYFIAYKTLNPLFKFLINCILLIVIWFGFYSLLRNESYINLIYENATQYITDFLVKSSGVLLNLIGYNTDVQGRMIRIEGTVGILLDRGCIGRNLLGLFAGFIIAYPGAIKTKLWYIPLGIMLINLINIIRISALALTLKYAPEYFNINHHAIFQYTVLILTFIMWYFWIKKLANKKVTKKERNKN
jgi:exosortase/archaeosortase family protein